MRDRHECHHMTPSCRLPKSTKFRTLDGDFRHQAIVGISPKQVQRRFHIDQQFRTVRKLSRYFRATELLQATGNMHVRAQVTGGPIEDFEKAPHASLQQPQSLGHYALSKPNLWMIASLVSQAAAPLQKLSQIPSFHDQPSQPSLSLTEFRMLFQDFA